MIITCEQCETRFQLDDERVPAKGAKVRCSRCRHAFYVKPTARRGDPVEDAVDQALSRDAEAPPSGSTEPLNPAAALQPDGLDALANTANPEPTDLDSSAAEDLGDGTLGDDAPRDEAAVQNEADIGDEAAVQDDNDEGTPFAEAPDGKGFDLASDDLPDGGDWTFNTDSIDDPSELSASFSGPSALSRTEPVDFGQETGLDAGPEREAAGGGLDAANEAIDDLLSGSDAAADDEDIGDHDIDTLLDPASSAADNGFEASPVADLGADSHQPASADTDVDAQRAELDGMEAQDGDPLGDSLDTDLGTPENWDFFDQPDGAPGEQASKAQTGAPLMSAVVPTVDTGSLPRPPIEVEIEASGKSAQLERIGHMLGSAIVSILLVAGLITGIGPRTAERSPVSAPTRLAGLEATDLRGRWVDNLAAGPIYVVSGVIRNTSGRALAPQSTFVVRLHDASGAVVLENAATLGSALAPDRLRERAPTDLRKELDTSGARWAWRPLPAGGERKFEAVLSNVPPEAVGFELVAVPVPRPDPVEAPWGGASVRGASPEASSGS